ncbi:G-protein coupled receptor Mth2-like [Anoplolepis gracilipes]|uniref:G-protein coupled receptor Mth2-like n=1 Tax=Anoplolepis gracilipes TaxID=354296 RepID=UPI003B9F3CD9
MCKKNFAFWWFCAFLFIPSNHQQNITNNEEVDDNLTMRYELNENTKINFTSQKIYRDLIGIEGNNDFTPHEMFDKTSNGNDNKYNTVSYEKCANIICISLCCPLGNRFDEEDNICISDNIKYSFPNVYEYMNDLLQTKNKTVDELFNLTVYDPCQTYDRFLLPYGYQYDFKIFTNGSLYLSYYEEFVKRSLYCLAVIEDDKFEVTFCANTSDEITGDDTKLIESINGIYVSYRIVSILFLMSIFLVYSILPDLQKTHSFMLRNYSGTLSVAYTFEIVNIVITADTVHYSVCLTVAFFNYFCFLTSFLWLTIMSFDMWWTFRGLCLLRRNIKQREKNKLVFYAIYAWGLPFILAVISIIMDSVSENLPQILRPEFSAGNCWFSHKGSFALYYYGLKSVCVISSICLSIFTAVKIARYERDTGRRLTDLESKRYKDNKKWFNQYLKLFSLLFIMTAIKGFLIVSSWVSASMSLYNLFSFNLMDIMQNLCTFIIFVWKKKVKQMLLKRFGYSYVPEAGSTNATLLSSTNSATMSGETLSMQKKSSCKQKNCHPKDSFDGTEI